jgi:hypothetical protein
VSSHIRETLDLQDLRAALADDDCVGVREDGGDGETSRALDVHEERAGSGHERLELVLAGLTRHLLVACRYREAEDGCVRDRGGVEEVNCENLGHCQRGVLIEMAVTQGEWQKVAAWTSCGKLRESRVPAHSACRTLLEALAGSDSPF